MFYARWVTARTLRGEFYGNAYPFSGSTQYRVTLHSYYLSDEAGNALGEYSWTFTTRPLRVAVQNQRGYYDAFSGYYCVFGEILNQEPAVIAAEYWGSSSPSSPLQVDLTYRDATGSVVATESTLSPWIGGLKEGQKVPFSGIRSDPSQRIQSFTAALNLSDDRLRRVDPYGFSVSMPQDRRALGGDGDNQQSREQADSGR